MITNPTASAAGISPSTEESEYLDMSIGHSDAKIQIRAVNIEGSPMKFPLRENKISFEIPPTSRQQATQTEEIFARPRENFEINTVPILYDRDPLIVVLELIFKDMNVFKQVLIFMIIILFIILIIGLIFIGAYLAKFNHN